MFLYLLLCDAAENRSEPFGPPELLRWLYCGRHKRNLRACGRLVLCTEMSLLCELEVSAVWNWNPKGRASSRPPGDTYRVRRVSHNPKLCIHTPVAHSQADCRARGGRETATQLYTDCPSWRAFKEPLTSTAIDTRLASRNTCEAGDSAGVVHSQLCKFASVSMCVGPLCATRAWCRFLVFWASGTIGSFPSRPRESTSPI